MADTDKKAQTPSTYISPLRAGFDFHFDSAYTIYPYTYESTDEVENTYSMEVTEPSGKVIRIPDYVRIARGGGVITEEGENVGITLNLTSGVYQVRYVYKREGFQSGSKTNTATYKFQAVENQYPIHKQTVEEVIDRIFDLIEPKCYDSATQTYVKPPRFHFEYKHPENTEAGKAERKLFNQTAPEFAFTRMTLREVLQEIGKFIHAEPRLKSVKSGAWIFDRYGEQEYAKFKRVKDGEIIPFNEHPYVGKMVRYGINTVNTHIESDAENFVNRLDKLGGTIAEPYRNGAETLRADRAYLRFEDDESSMYFPTPMGIMDVTKLYWVDINGDAGKAGAKYDITAYVFEQTAYDAELSSYDEQYPRSKAFGLYFTQGEKHIRGFFFKNEKWKKEVFANYAIVNILEQVTQKPLKNILTGHYPELAFELVYTPIYGTRLAHGKSYTGDLLKRPFALMYNQSANVIETRYYGEHVKGVAQRLGNAEKVVQIMLLNPNNVPKIGQKWDDEYYISYVKGKAIPDCIGVEIGLTKNFNRLSEYVGANSYKRYYEVSERMAVDRRTLYRDYLVITDKTSVTEKDCFVNASTLCAVANTFYQSAERLAFGEHFLETEIASCVQAQGFTKSLNSLTSVLLPVISSAFGNVMNFTWSYKDNYSAGVSSTYQNNGKTGDDHVNGYFGAEVTYGDYYGQMYYQKYTLQGRISGITLQQSLALPQAHSGNVRVSYAGTQAVSNDVYRIIRKDSREVLSQSYQIEYVTDKKNLIIGSALARNNPMIGGIETKARARLYILPDRVNQFTNDEIDLDSGTFVAEMFKNVSIDPNRYMELQFNTVNGSNYISCPGRMATVTGKAWAIVSAPYDGTPYEEQDEEGNVQTVTPHYGGELLLAENIDVNVGDTIAKFNIVPTHDIFEFTKRS